MNWQPEVITKHVNGENERIAICKAYMHGKTPVEVLVIYDDGPNGTPAPMLLDEGTKQWLRDYLDEGTYDFLADEAEAGYPSSRLRPRLTLQAEVIDQARLAVALSSTAGGIATPEEWELVKAEMGVDMTHEEWIESHEGDDEQDLYDRSEDIAHDLVHTIADWAKNNPTTESSAT